MYYTMTGRDWIEVISRTRCEKREYSYEESDNRTNSVDNRRNYVREDDRERRRESLGFAASPDIETQPYSRRIKERVTMMIMFMLIFPSTSTLLM